ncbi:hypothetical protein HPP92_000510 [Vanilla planifolia]|uniref:Dicer-like 3 n=1 Tax=Vanilla planifolia TaxID=51239 RepID=A0A835VKN1_VANPL|nr:hypothetical protein HPP92_000510 [Vanilla planifolia]
MEGEELMADARKRKRCLKDFEPRSYQVMVFEVAMRRNTIAVLDTGAGKTMIAVMMIKEIGRVLRLKQDGGLIVFLAPTVHLVTQQCEVIKIHTDLTVSCYYGEKGIDQWDEKSWKKEMSTNQVMVMTPQIMLDALRKAFLAINVVRLLVFDECHRATGNHCYTRIMKEFYHKSLQRPTIFGMTASPIIGKGGSSITDCESQFTELESVLDAKIYAVADRSEMDAYVPSVTEVKIYYDPMLFIQNDLKRKLGLLLNKFDDAVINLSSCHIQKYSDSEEILRRCRVWLSSWHSKFCYCLDELGVSCASEVAEVCSAKLCHPYSAECNDFAAECMKHCKSFVEQSRRLVQESLSQDYKTLLNTETGWQKAKELGYISSKLCELMHIFRSFDTPGEGRCLVFVERKITAKVLGYILKHIDCLSHLEASYLTGGSSSIDALTQKMQKETLDLFRLGKVNILFTTDVAEEGLHIPECSCVIRFDLPKTVRSYVQSRGRARRFGSRYIVMLERGNAQQRSLLFDIVSSKYSMMDAALNRDHNALIPKLMHYDEPISYRVESTGATVTADASVGLVYKYCEKLPKDKYFTPRPAFQFDVCGGNYECTLTLPASAAFGTIVGPFCRNSHLAKQLACLEACKLLHHLGMLDGHLNPINTEPLEYEIDGKTKDSAGIGTTKRKELYGTTPVLALSGTWAHKEADVCVDLNLHLVGKMVKASVSPCGPIQLEIEQVQQAKRFQELFFNGLFGKLYRGSKSSDLKREFLLNTNNILLWNSSNMYMLLPLKPSCSLHDDLAHINWEGINAVAFVVEYISSLYSEGVEFDLPKERQDSLDCRYGSSESDVIQLANKPVSVENIKDMVVMAVHSGKIYSVLNIMPGSSADSPFDGTRFRTFKEYFKAKYGIVLQYPEQPLLLLKHSHNPHNLLSSSGNLEASQLRKEIGYHSADSSVSSSLILEAITTLRCCEEFSLERLELLGDSVLKYAVSCYLFLKFPEKHEGQLSACRAKLVCNATLHKLGTQRNLQGYIRDAAFDPRRWVAPGQLSIRAAPCMCGVDTLEVPLGGKYVSEDKNIVIGKTCDMGHRWICSKTVSDCVEALIGAYYVGGGLNASRAFMKWLGLEARVEMEMVEEAIRTVLLRSLLPKHDELEILEAKVGYKFKTKGLLLEAITHASQQELGVSYCYQRLEFLGDSVLDILITWHLFRSHGDIDPGMLTDLRSASVNNDNFAQVAVKHKLQQHILHGSGFLLEQITEYVKLYEKSLKDEQSSLPSCLLKAPKVLGDIVESIAGAILLDTKLDLGVLWGIFEPLLSPIVTPAMLELPPFRELSELCSRSGYFLNVACVDEDDMVLVTLDVQLKDVLLVRQARNKNIKSAKGQAALLLLNDMEEKGFTHSRHASKSGQHEGKMVQSKHHEMKLEIETSEKLIKPTHVKFGVDDVMQPSDICPSPPAISLSVKMKKGGPRSAIYDLCKRSHWPMPSFDTKADALSTNGKKGVPYFISSITLHLPDLAIVNLTGESRLDKKSSQDSAALLMLYELEKQGRCSIKEV